MVCVCVCARVSHSVVSESFVTPWTGAHQAPLSTGFPRQEYWSGLPFPSPEDLPDPGIEPMSSALQADSLPAEPQGKPLFFHNMTGRFPDGSVVKNPPANAEDSSSIPGLGRSPVEGNGNPL